MAIGYKNREVMLKINSAINEFNIGIDSLRTENYRKTLEQEEPVIRSNAKKSKTDKQSDTQYDTNSYETYIKDVLDSLQAPGMDQLQWTKVIENTCNTANNLLIVIKDKKHQLASSQNPEDNKRINKELQEELKSLKRLKAMIENQKILQELEKKQLAIAYQKVEQLKLRELVFMVQLLQLSSRVAIKLLADKIREEEEKKEKEKKEKEEKEKKEKEEKEKLLADKAIVNTKLKTEQQKEQTNVKSSTEEKETTSKDPVFLPNKDEIGIKSSTLSVINTDASEISSAKYDPTTLFDKKEKENRSKSSIILSAISAVSNNSISFGPSEENKTKSIMLLPAHKVVVIEEDKSKSKKSKKQKKAKLKQNDEEVLSAVIDGKQFIVYKKVKGSQGYKVIRHGDIIKEQLSNGTYILSPITKDSRDIMFKDEFKDNYFTLKIKKEQKIKLGEDFKEKVTEYKSAAYKSRETINGQSIIHVKSPTMLPNRSRYGRGKYTR